MCHDCFHCASGHEMHAIKVDDLRECSNFTQEMVCVSCENELESKLWACEKIAQAVAKSEDVNTACADRSLIC